MEALLEDIIGWMSALHPAWIYATLLVVAWLENVVPPIPGDMVVVFGGYLAGLGIVFLTPVLLLSTVGGALGFMTMYVIGWRFGPAVFDPDRLRWVPKEPALRARAWLQRHGFRVVAANRFLSGLRSVIALAVGAARMDPRAALVWSTASSAAWCALLVWAGYAVGDQWAEIAAYLRLYGRWVTIVLVVAGGGYLAWWAWGHRRLVRLWARQWRARRSTPGSAPHGTREEAAKTPDSAESDARGVDSRSGTR